MVTLKCILLTTHSDIREMEELLRTLNWTLVSTVGQTRPSPDPRYFLGRGKINELALTLSGELSGMHPDTPTAMHSNGHAASFPDEPGRMDVDLIIANAELQPNQRFNLEQTLHLEVYDRIRVILEIFRHRSVSEEARLQVELAALRYEIPWIREVVHQSRSRERPGWHAGGEYPTRQHIARAHRRQRQIQNRLSRLERNRGMMRSNRRRRGFLLASITGYTNAGKSTLFNALTASSVLVDDRMFATLSTTTRRFGYGDSGLLLTDTIGFLRDLPPWMVRAFNATMEEIHGSDVVILVLDGSEPVDEILGKTETCLTLLSSPPGPAARLLDIPGNEASGTTRGSWTGDENGWHPDAPGVPISWHTPDPSPSTEGSQAPNSASVPDTPFLLAVLGKIDLLDDQTLGVRLDAIGQRFPGMEVFPVSVPSRVGLDLLREKLVSLDRILRPGGTRTRNGPG